MSPQGSSATSVSEGASTLSVVALVGGVVTTLVVGGLVVWTLVAAVPKVAMAQLDAYMVRNGPAIKQAIHLGAGAALDDLAVWFGVPEGLRTRFGEALRRAHTDLDGHLAAGAPDAFAVGVWAAMLRDPALARFLRDQGVLRVRVSYRAAPRQSDESQILPWIRLR